MSTAWHDEEVRPASRHHPQPAELLAFVRCETSETAARVIVRHLLRGCATCAATIRPELERAADAAEEARRSRARGMAPPA